MKRAWLASKSTSLWGGAGGAVRGRLVSIATVGICQQLVSNLSMSPVGCASIVNVVVFSRHALFCRLVAYVSMSAGSLPLILPRIILD
jgi:hypothetical protein